MQLKKVLGLAVWVLALTAITEAHALADEWEGGSGNDDAFLSRITVAFPFYTHHFPKDGDFNDHNWGGVIFYALDRHISLVGGDFTNSYRRNTAFAGLSFNPWDIGLSAIQISPGALVGIDLTGGYKDYDPLEPVLAAATLQIRPMPFDDPHFQFLDRLGLLVTVIPGFGNDRSTASNLALTIRL